MFNHDVEIFKELSNEDYHKKSAVSSSGLSLIDKGAFYFWDKHINPDRKEERRREAFIIGDAVHTMVLEPEKAEETIAVYPFGIRGDKKLAFEKENAGKLLITSSVHAKAEGMRDAVRSHPLAAQYLTGPGVVEQSIFWTWSKALPVRCRVRPDLVTGDGVLVDLKTTKSVRPASFIKSIELFRYHVQAGFYTEGYTRAFGRPPKKIVYIAVEKIPPYHVGVFELDIEDVRLGRELAVVDLMKYHECMETGLWGAAEPEKLRVSQWQRRVLEQKKEELRATTAPLTQY